MPSSYARQSFLGRTLSGVMNASLNGVPMRLNPTSIQLDYTVKTSETPTLGGMVVQVFGIEMSDLIVEGTFGKGGYTEQLAFLNRMLGIANMQSNQALVTPSPAQPVRFVYPNRGFDFQVYLKDYDSASGMAIDYENTNIAPDWRLTLFVDNDNLHGGLAKVAADAYIARLSNGLGYTLNKYNMQMSVADVQAFLKSQNFANDPTGYLNAAFGGAAQQTASTTPSSGGTPTTAASGTQQQNIKTIYNYLIANGYSKYGAAGIVVCIGGESGWDPESQGSGGAGLIGWTPPSSASPNPKIVTGDASADLDVQLGDIIGYNNAQGATLIAQLNGKTSIKDAADFYSEKFERPAVTDSDVHDAIITLVEQTLGIS
jgi:hypothetical protein